jgi:glycosyltransferase involved in cell wall biosynthesis
MISDNNKYMQKILIISYAPERNRQGFDLASICSENANSVTLFQLSDRNEFEQISKTLDIRRISYINSKIILKGKGLLTLAKAFLNTIRMSSPKIVVGINLYGLIVASLLGRLRNTKVIYYCLEIPEGIYKNIERWLIQHCCDAVVGVEENRLQVLIDSSRNTIPTFVIPNTPRRGIALPLKGQLRKYLTEKYQISPNRKIVLLHGSYQSYLGIELILDTIKSWNPEAIFVLMLTDEVPQHIITKIKENNDKAFLVPPANHIDLYNWIVDADIGLLPYESCQSIAVRFCSPQKLFDYMACGVPILGSKRPIIQKVLNTYHAGSTIDFTNHYAISDGINEMLSLSTESLLLMRQQARECYEREFNYDEQARELIAFIDNLN